MDKLQILFANHGIPSSVVNDNASVFVSVEITSSPYYPAC